MSRPLGRRRFLKQTAAAGVLGFMGGPRLLRAQEPLPADDHTLTVISGKPRERGREYGCKFRGAIHGWLDREIYQAFTHRPGTRGEMMRYAGQCTREIRSYAPTVLEELEGMAEGSELKLEELVLGTLHEELYHEGILPASDHCTGLAVGPPDTRDGNSYVGQTWDWHGSTYGHSSVLAWKRPEGPSVLTYAYPGLWVSAGLNSAGVALCWTGAYPGGSGPRVGIPTYVLIAQMLYQESLEAALAEARRSTHAGWFTFVLADGRGDLASVEGSPEALSIEKHRGILARHQYGNRDMTGTPEGREVDYQGPGLRMRRRLVRSQGNLDGPRCREILADHGGGAEEPICHCGGTVDAMLFNTTKGEAFFVRGPACSGRWKSFRFPDA
jgi:isopenicillin-N N-acyltransferase-like protein